jgi:hypothetical protein
MKVSLTADQEYVILQKQGWSSNSVVHKDALSDVFTVLKVLRLL